MPWLAVAPGEVTELVAAYRQAQALAALIRLRLLAEGFSADLLPVIAAGVSPEGEPVVLVEARGWLGLDSRRRGSVTAGGERRRRRAA